MKITTTTGLVGFLLALSAFSLSKADAVVNLQPANEPTQPTIESRLSRLSAAVKQQENQIQTSSQNEANSFYVAGGVFLNKAPSFRNYTTGWHNNWTGWRNTGSFVNTSGGSFLNKAPSFRNNVGGWHNNWGGWRNR